jgi:hypothetical protein
VFGIMDVWDCGFLGLWPTPDQEAKEQGQGSLLWFLQEGRQGRINMFRAG